MMDLTSVMDAAKTRVTICGLDPAWTALRVDEAPMNRDPLPELTHIVDMRTSSPPIGFLRALVGTVAAVVCSLVPAAFAAQNPVVVAPGVHVLVGDLGEITPQNHGVVGNSGFVVGDSGAPVTTRAGTS